MIIRACIAMLALALAASACDAVDGGTDVAQHEAALTTTTYFDSNATWPPTVRNNRDDLTGTFVLNFFGTCANGLAPSISSGTVTNPSAYTGNGTTSAQLVTCSDTSYNEMGPSTFLQLDNTNKTIGLWLNPTRLRGTTLVTATPGFRLNTPFPTPWTTSTAKVSLQYDAILPNYDWVPGDPVVRSVPYNSGYIIVENAAGLRMWYGASVFDPRGCTPDYIAWDSGSNMPVVDGCLITSDTLVQPGSGSSTFSSSSWSTTRHFDMTVDRAHLKNGLIAYNSWASQNFRPQWPTTDADLAAIKLVAWFLNPETADLDSNRYDRLRVSLASTYTSPVNMGVYYQRSDLGANWQYAKAVTVPAGWSGWGPIDIDLRDVNNFAGRITAISLNPAAPGGSSAFGYDWMDFQDPSSGIITKIWNLTGLPNPMTSTFTSDGSTFWTNFFSNLGTDGTKWWGTLGSSPSFQWTVANVPVDPTPMLGASFKNMKLMRIDN